MLAQIGDVTKNRDAIVFHHIPCNFTPGMQFQQNPKKLHLLVTTILAVY